jgi:hypothetical protein
MMRTFVATCFAVAIAFANCGTLEANWYYPWSSGYYSASYYYPAPAVRYYYYVPAAVYVAPLCPAPAAQPVPMYAPGFANPMPAPPSPTKEPPLAKPAGSPPTVIESRTKTHNDSNGAKGVESGNKDVCKVGFWNVSGGDVNLIVNGKTHTIPRNRNVTLMVSREFTYQINAQEPRMERVPNDKTAHEIVIR